MSRWSMACAMVLTLAGTPAWGQETLVWRFKEGETLRYASKMKMKQNMTMMGNDISVNMDMKTVAEMAVKKTTSGGPTVIEHKIVEMGGTMNGPMGEMNLDDQFKSIIGAAYTVTISPTGEILKVEGVEEFFKRISGDNPIAGQMLASMMQEDNLKQQLASNFSFLPAKPVSKGDHWEQKSSVPLGPMGKFVVKLDYIYEGRDNVEGKDLAKISFTATMKFEAGKPDDNAPFQITQADFKSTTMKGTYYFDSAAGAPSCTRPPTSSLRVR